MKDNLPLVIFPLLWLLFAFGGPYFCQAYHAKTGNDFIAQWWSFGACMIWLFSLVALTAITPFALFVLFGGILK